MSKKKSNAALPTEIVTMHNKLLTPEKYRMLDDENVTIITSDNGRISVGFKGSAAKEDKGYFWVPQHGKKTGKWYLVGTEETEYWARIVVIVPSLCHSLHHTELIYLRDLFFNKDAVVQQYIPRAETYVKRNDTTREVCLWCSVAPIAVPKDAMMLL